MTNARQAAEQAGRRAEQMAALWLQLKGYRILARRFRSGFGEIDLVARRGDTLVAVEVKARAHHADALAILTRQTLARVLTAATQLQPYFDKKGCLTIRVDAVTIAPWRLPRHIVNVIERC